MVTPLAVCPLPLKTFSIREAKSSARVAMSGRNSPSTGTCIEGRVGMMGGLGGCTLAGEKAGSPSINWLKKLTISGVDL